MPNPISSISGAPSIELIAPAGEKRGGGEFQKVLSGAIGQVQAAQDSAAQSVQRFLSGDGEELHTTVLATQKAELEFELFLQAKNKVVQAYQEIMRMQL